jgi:hypothetical protein
MKHIDVLSRRRLALRLSRVRSACPRHLEGLSYSVVTHKPVLFAARCSNSMGNPGPAGIASKRDWTYRQVAWQAHSLHGVGAADCRRATRSTRCRLLRQALACDASGGSVNRFVCEHALAPCVAGWSRTRPGCGSAWTDLGRRGWRRSCNPFDADGRHAPRRCCRQQHRCRRCALGVFGVPVLRGRWKSFSGALTALPMLRAYLLKAITWFEARLGRCLQAWRKACRR